VGDPNGKAFADMLSGTPCRLYRNIGASKQPFSLGILVKTFRTHFLSTHMRRGSEGWRSGFSMVEPWTKKVKLRLDSVDSLRRRVVWAVGSVENGFGGGI
jgi:hypothetical protein